MKTNLDITKYTAFFHDGTLDDIHAKENSLFFSLKAQKLILLRLMNKEYYQN